MKFFSILIITCFFLIFEKSYSKINNLISVKIGNKIITNYELKNKILTTLILSDQEINQSNINKLKSQSLESLIQKKIKEIELEKFSFQADNKRISDYLNTISSNNIEQFKQKFKDNNISFSLFLEEIEIQFKWQKLILTKYANQVKINDDMVNKEIQEIIKKQKNFLELRLSEIEISINNDSKDQEKIMNLKKLINDIGFKNAALKFSTSPSSSDKGDLGWVSFNSLSKEVKSLLQNLNIGEISEPIVKSGSATIFKIEEKRTSDIKNLKVDNIKKNLISRKKNELFNLYSQSLLSKLKNQTLIQYSNE